MQQRRGGRDVGQHAEGAGGFSSTVPVPSAPAYLDALALDLLRLPGRRSHECAPRVRTPLGRVELERDLDLAQDLCPVVDVALRREADDMHDQVGG